LYASTVNSNSAYGYAALVANTTGQYNTAIGGLDASNLGCLDTNTTGGYNTALGAGSLHANTTASYNTAVGYQALYTTTTGANNTGIGYGAISSVTTGSGNVGAGYLAGSSVTTGTYNVYVGYNSNASGGAVTQELVIGTLNSTGKGSTTAFINGGGGNTYNGANSTTWATTSDRRLKKNIVDNKTGLEKITGIQVRNFEYRLPEEVTELDSQNAIQKTGVQLGVIAQELQVILPDCVKTESTGVMSVDADNLTWYMVNAIKELKSELDSVKAELATLKGA
jgi:hypothetical protein